MAAEVHVLAVQSARNEIERELLACGGGLRLHPGQAAVNVLAALAPTFGPAFEAASDLLAAGRVTVEDAPRGWAPGLVVRHAAEGVAHGLA